MVNGIQGLVKKLYFISPSYSTSKEQHENPKDFLKDAWLCRNLILGYDRALSTQRGLFIENGVLVQINAQRIDTVSEYKRVLEIRLSPAENSLPKDFALWLDQEGYQQRPPDDEEIKNTVLSM